MQYLESPAFIVMLTLVAVLSGCALPEEPVQVILPAKYVGEQPQKATSPENRFREPTTEERTAVKSAVELSGKYAALTQEAAALANTKVKLTEENTRLRGKIAALQLELEQTQKELTEANNLLREMLAELNNWKSNVLGFQQEMREADKTQLEALLKILKLLGGEVKVAAEMNAETNASTGN
jgi:chromosome segregation ATPase